MGLTLLTEENKQASLSFHESPESLGQLVPLGFDIAAFTPAAYLRHRL